MRCYIAKNDRRRSLARHRLIWPLWSGQTCRPIALVRKKRREDATERRSRLYQALRKWNQHRNSAILTQPVVPTPDLEHRFSLARIQSEVCGVEAPGITVGDYEVLRKIGRGAFGVVFEVRHVATGERLALKTLARHPEIEVSRLVTEFRAAAEIGDPNLVRLYELDTTGDEPYFVMELVDGRDIATVLREYGRVGDWAGFESTVRQLASGLSALHRHGFVHCDVKPQNALVTACGRVVVLDFGLARGRNSSPWLPEGGTPGYDAPERQRDYSAPPTAAMDIYSLGVLSASALADDPRALDPEHAQARFPSDAPVSLKHSIIAMCATDPDERPTALEVSGQVVSPAEPEALPLLGRDQELVRLRSAVETREKPQVVVVEGASGTGKTTLVGHLVAELRERGCLVFTGRCHEREQVAYGGIDQVIDGLVEHLESLSPNVADYLLAGAAGLLSEAFPAFGRLAERVATLSTATPFVSSNLDVGGLLKRLLRRLAVTEHVIIWIDDLQWLDRDGEHLLSRLIREPERPELCFVVSYRGALAERRPHVAELVERMRADPGSASIELSGLEDSAAMELVRRVDGNLPTQRMADILDASERTPYLLIELARQGSAWGEAGRWFEARVGQLSDSARRVLDLIALARGPIAREVVLAAADCTEIGVQTIDELRLAKLVSSEHTAAGSVDCAHARIRKAALEAVVDRASGHADLVVALLRHAPEEHSAIAWHAHGANMAETAYRHAERAAHAAEVGSAFERAAEFWTIAERWAEKPEDRGRCAQRMAQAWSRARKSSTAAESFLRAQTLLRGPERSIVRVQAARELYMAGEIDRARALTGEICPPLARTFRSSSVVNIVRLLLTRTRLWFRGMRYQRRNESDIEVEELLALDTHWIAGQGVAHADLVQCGLINEMSVEYALRLGEPKRIARSMALAAVTMTGYKGSGGAQAERFIIEAEQLADENGDVYTRGIVKLYTSFARSNLGHWAQAVREAEVAERLLSESPAAAMELMFAHGAVLNGLRLLGDYGRYAQRVDQIIDSLIATGNAKMLSDMRTWSAMKCVLQDDYEGAIEQTEAMVVGVSEQQYSHIALARTHSRVRAMTYAGKYRECLSQFDEGTKVIRRAGWWWLLQVRVDARSWRARLCAAIYAESKERSFARRARRELAQLEKERCPSVKGTAACVRASLRFSDGKFDAAVRELRRAVNEFDAAGMEFELMGARLRLAEHTQPDEAKLLRERVDAYQEKTKIVNPAKLARLVVPPPI